MKPQEDSPRTAPCGPVARATLSNALAELTTELQEHEAADQRFAEHVEAFAQRLESHFNAEEVDGLFRQLTARAPRLEEKVGALREAHERLRLLADDVLARARTRLNNDLALKTDLKQLRETFLEHETKENALLQQVYCVDLGEGD